VMRAVLDGAGVDCGDGRVRVPLDAGSHKLLISRCFGVNEDVNSVGRASRVTNHASVIETKTATDNGSRRQI
jgi:hypothetical protein